MKTPLETARRWLAQANDCLGQGRALLESSFWAGACFQAEQASQMALKAYLFWRGRRFVQIHSVRTLAQECVREDAAFLPFEDYGIILDRYYLATRYPDVLPAPAVPFESFTQSEARQALAYAAEIVELVQDRVPEQ